MITRSQRRYTQAELALFAAYRDARAQVPPDACIYAGPDEALRNPQGQAGCWVDEGPPALTTHGNAARCRRCRWETARSFRE